MKIRLCALILTSLVLSCNEELIGVDNSQTISILGKWQWVRSYGGVVGIITPPPGTVIIHTYTSDGIFSVSRNDTIQIILGYSIEKQKSNYSNELHDFILFHDSMMVKQVIWYLSADTLCLGDDMRYCFSSIYIRAGL
jgi:hypothetical protein